MMRNSISLARVSHPRAAPLRSPSFGPHSLHLLTGWPSAAVTGSGPAANDPVADIHSSSPSTASGNSKKSIYRPSMLPR